jgi:hypothetical protein
LHTESGHPSQVEDRNTTRSLLDSMLRAAGRLSAIADELDSLRARSLSSDQRDARDRLLREQRDARTRFDHAEARLRTKRIVVRS